MQRWPNVPAVYGWLRLDTAGRWRLEGRPVRHPGLAEFIGRNYLADERGAWYFQNGPQRVYVELDHAPWVLQLDAQGRLRDQTGALAVLGDRGVIDEECNLVLSTRRGPALLGGEALVELIDCLRDAEGRPVTPETLEALMTGEARRGLRFVRDGHELALEPLAHVEIPARLGFIRVPEPA